MNRISAYALILLFTLLFILLFGGSSCLAAYRNPAPALVLNSTVPLIPATAWLYLSLPLFLVCAARRLNIAAQWRFFLLLTGELVVASIAFQLYPVHVHFMQPENPQGAGQTLLRLAHTIGMSHNYLPSLHCAFATTAAALLHRHVSRPARAVIWLYAAAINISTLTIHAHHWLDLVAGNLLVLLLWQPIRRLARATLPDYQTHLLWLHNQARFARRHPRYALVSLILYSQYPFHPKRSKLMIAGYCFLQAFDDLMDGDRQTARTADEEARRLIREWRHGRFDENDPYSRLAADFRGRLKTSEASFCEAKTDIEGLDEAKANAKHPGKTETALPAAAARFALTRTLGLLHTMHLDRLRAERAQLWTEAEIAAQHRRTFTRSLDLLLAALGSSVRGRDLPELVDALGWCSTMRDLPEDLRAGIVNIPSELWRQAGWPSEKRHDPAALSADAAFRDWMRQERSRALQLLDQADRRTAALNDGTARRISNLFARSVRRFAEQRLPARYPWLNGPTDQAV